MSQKPLSYVCGPNRRAARAVYRDISPKACVRDAACHYRLPPHIPSTYHHRPTNDPCYTPLTQQEEQPRGRARQSTPVWERLTRTPTTSNSGAAATQPPPSRGGANSVSAPPAPAASPCSKGSQQPGTQRLQQLVRGKERSTTSVKPSAAPRGGKAGGRQLQTRLPSLKPQQKLPAQVAVSAAAPSTPPQQQEVKPPSLLADAAAGAMADSMMPSTHTAAWEAHAGAPRSWRGTELVTPLAGGVTHHHHHEGASFSGVGGGRRVSRVHEVVQQGHMPTAGSAARISLILNVYQGGGR